MNKLDRIGIVGQWFGGTICGVGVGIEIAMHAELGFVVISIGSLIFAAFTKVRKI
jgi:hypothetical protein